MYGDFSHQFYGDFANIIRIFTLSTVKMKETDIREPCLIKEDQVRLIFFSIAMACNHTLLNGGDQVSWWCQ